jgi:two-component system, LytTR family, response regulator
MKVVIIEDEALVARDLQKMLAAIDPSIEILAVLNSLSACRKWFDSNLEPDLIFADIQLSDGVSFELFQERAIGSPVIFTTAYNEYAIKAFKLNSIDYLLKPIDREDLEQAIEKYKRLHQNKAAGTINEQLKSLLSQLPQAGGMQSMYKERFMVHYNHGLMPLQANQIAYFVKDPLIYAVTLDNKKYVADFETLEEVEHLADPKTFFRANRQYIVHINAVENFRSTLNGKVIVKLKAPLQTEVDVSREKASAFKAWLA